MLFERKIGPTAIPILKGFRPKAQGCEERATLGLRGGVDSTLKGLWWFLYTTWSVARATTLSGLSHGFSLFPRAARSSQPWALRRNPFGILLMLVLANFLSSDGAQIRLSNHTFTVPDG